jgi:hypothetical protein
VLDDLLHLHLMPVAGVGDQYAGRVGHPDRRALVQRGITDRADQPEVGRADGISAAIT